MSFKVFYSAGPLPSSVLKEHPPSDPSQFETRPAAIDAACDLLLKGAAVYRIECSDGQIIDALAIAQECAGRAEP